MTGNEAVDCMSPTFNVSPSLSPRLLFPLLNRDFHRKMRHLLAPGLSIKYLKGLEPLIQNVILTLFLSYDARLDSTGAAETNNIWEDMQLFCIETIGDIEALPQYQQDLHEYYIFLMRGLAAADLSRLPAATPSSRIDQFPLAESFPFLPIIREANRKRP
ncbi:hypothetical protein BDK51DRAFT_50453 [Blyttiomyces helicus]|uniref:Uncharacterized protein n=1 Tax=Blyttiomyces helicus TaxID=388810 RepID=A0A4P9WHB0_9FUNG|nr:hypothetical protein BDK51DRAFT_50453 [Blyttiomyces helicus]|eukprot:RKO90460.1 hypothetical protein BDK51DRAFT_50453 [Blyttiomyces helicus]